MGLWIRVDWRVLVRFRILSCVAPCFNHLAHHRGQLTIYLRLNGIAGPPVYGPTADEGRF